MLLVRKLVSSAGIYNPPAGLPGPRGTLLPTLLETRKCAGPALQGTGRAGGGGGDVPCGSCPPPPWGQPTAARSLSNTSLCTEDWTVTAGVLMRTTGLSFPLREQLQKLTSLTHGQRQEELEPTTHVVTVTAKGHCCPLLRESCGGFMSPHLRPSSGLSTLHASLNRYGLCF